MSTTTLRRFCMGVLLLPGFLFAQGTIFTQSPAQGAVDVSVSNVTFAWIDVARPVIPGSEPPILSPYTLQLNTDAAFTPGTNLLDTSVDSTHFTFQPAHPLALNTTYYWQVFVPIDKGGNGSVAQGSFTTLDMPGFVFLISPVYGAANIEDGQVFLWQRAAHAAAYRLQFALDTGFTSGLVDTLLNDTAAAIAKLQRGKNYFWRVRGENGAGAGSWSGNSIFTTLPPPPPVPTLVSPANDSIHLHIPVQITWQSLSDAIWYHVQVSKDSTFATVAVEDTADASTSLFLYGVDEGATYYWRVRAKNFGGASAWSSPFRFSVVPPLPAIPVPVAPAQSAINVPLRPTLVWKKSAGADFYRLVLYKDNNLDSVAANLDSLKDTTAQVGPLQPYHLYLWKLEAVNFTGSTSNAGATSLGSNFVTVPYPPGAPVPIMPVRDTLMPAAFVGFSFGTAAVDPLHGPTEAYRIQVSADSAFASTLLDSVASIGYISYFDRLQSGKRYFWRVQASGLGGESPWAYASFRTPPDMPGKAVPIYPAAGNMAVPDTFVFLWHAAARAEKYALSASYFDGGKIVQLASDTLADTSLAVAWNLPGMTSVFWTLSVFNAGGRSDTSLYFMTLPPPPGKPRLISPAADTQNVSVYAMYRWDTASHAFSYRFMLARTADFAQPILDTLVPAPGVFRLDTLLHGTKYWWRARGVNAGGQGEWSDAWAFTTIVASPARVTLMLPRDGDTLRTDSLAARWHASGPAVDRYYVWVSADSAFPDGSTRVDSTADTSLTVPYGAEPGRYYWTVSARNIAGLGPASAIQSFVSAPIPTALAPKDFSLKLSASGSGGELRYALPKAARVQIRFLDGQGRLRAVPLDAEQGAGRYALPLPDLPEGLYLLDFRAGVFRKRQRVMLGR